MRGKDYKLDQKTFKRLRGFNYLQMSRWVGTMCEAAFQEGKDSVADAETIEDIVEKLRTIKGIGPKRADAIRKVLEDDELQRGTENGDLHA